MTQIIEAQHIWVQRAALRALNGSHFAQKFNANLSQLFENTAIQTIFFHLFFINNGILTAFLPQSKQFSRVVLKGLSQKNDNKYHFYKA